MITRHHRSSLILIPAMALALCGLAAAPATEPPAKDAKPAARADAPAPSAAPSLLDPIKALAGEWEMTDEKGVKQLAAVYRITGGGSAVCETMFPGSAHEMVNMYHLNGPDTLVVTHYCAVGNQPRMTCKSPTSKTTFDFKTLDPAKDVTNLKSIDGMYMGSLVLTITDADHITQDWTHFDHGKEAGKVNFELVRKAKPIGQNEEQIRELIVRIRELQTERKYAEASKLVDEILVIDPRNPAGLMLRNIFKESEQIAKFSR